MPGGSSEQPTDLLIRALVQTRRIVTAEEIAQIIDQMATASFTTRQVIVPLLDRQLVYQGTTLGARASSLDYHIAKRIADEQWAPGLTREQFLGDIERTVRDSATRLLVFERRAGHIAAAIGLTERIVPEERRARWSEPHLLVVYSADWGTLLSGYQFSEIVKTGIPRDVQWLR